jgi:predicted PurR-regulated permease PerM
MPLEPTTTPADPTVQTILPELRPIPGQNTETAPGGNDSAEDAEILQASVKAGSLAQIVVAVIAVVGLVYLLKIVLVTTLLSILLAFVLEPLVSRLARIAIPRSVGALLAVALMVGLAGGLTYFFYNRAVDFATQLPKYSEKIHSALADLREQTSKLEESTRSVIAAPNPGKPPVAVEVLEAPGLSRLISAGSGTLGEVLLVISFIPFWCTSCLRGRIMRIPLPFSCSPGSIV